MLKLTRQYIIDRLQSDELDQKRRFKDILPFHDDGKFRQAAVLIPLLEKDDQWHILFTHRSSSLEEHRGQVSFPGGAYEKGDADLQQTALREMYEEIGVDPIRVDVLGELGEMPIITGYCVRVFVGTIPWPYPLNISKDEVESVFVVPINWLADPSHRKLRYRSFAGREFPVIYFDYFEGHQLWGASAEMTIGFLSALGLSDQ